MFLGKGNHRQGCSAMDILGLKPRFYLSSECFTLVNEPWESQTPFHYLKEKANIIKSVQVQANDIYKQVFVGDKLSISLY